MRNKGISPLISAVILIAIVIGVGTIISGWSSQFIKKQTGKVGERGQIDCVYSSLYFKPADVDCNLSGTPGLGLNVTVTNTGSVDLYDFEVTLTLADHSVYSYGLTAATNKTSSNPLKSGSKAHLNVNITDDLSGNTPAKVRVVAKNCPQNAYKEVVL